MRIRVYVYVYVHALSQAHVKRRSIKKKKWQADVIGQWLFALNIKKNK